MKQPCVYMLASKCNGTLYIGVTSDLIKRVWEHKQDFVEGFTAGIDREDESAMEGFV
jgi:putative endonuclease